MTFEYAPNMMIVKVHPQWKLISQKWFFDFAILFSTKNELSLMNIGPRLSRKDYFENNR